MHAPPPSTLALVALVPLLAWRIYIRFRRMVGRQRLSPARPWITLGVFTAFMVLLAFAAHSQVERLWWIAAGFPAGALLAVYGLRLTRFEPTPHGLFYTPNAHLGIALSLVFLGRILYRMFEVFSLQAAGASGPPSFTRSPLTLAVFGILAGYYMTYSLGLIRWRRRVERAGPELPEAT
jgi:hypothetical protein